MLDDIFELDKEGCLGKGKVVPLKEAVARCVRPGMKLHMNSGAYANAALREVIRQHWGKDPGFTLISTGVTTPYKISLALSGLAKKIVTSNYSFVYPTPRPIPLLQKLGKAGKIEVETWSLYSIEQRLMAGALGVGFMPAKSLMGTDVARENAHAFREIADPFDDRERIGVVKALRPDISLLHGSVADCEGNTIISPPYFAGIWGPRASREVIVTVERIVPAEFIREHSALVKLPGHFVKYVCLAPFGAHPQGVASESIGVGEGYGEDYEFIKEFVEASKDAAGLKAWIGEWVLACETEEKYLQKLGAERILLLKGKSSADAWRYPQAVTAGDEGTFNATEAMIVAGAREIEEIVKKRGYAAILAGIGAAGLAAWLAYYRLKQKNEPVTLLTGLGHIGYDPRPGDPFLMTLSNVMASTMLTDSVEAYGTFVGGANSRCLSILGTAQIDQYGNINTVKIDDAPFIGLGGAGDAINAGETLVIAKQVRSRFMEKIPYIGLPGEKVRTLVTDLGIFEKLGGEDVFTLVKLYQTDRQDEEGVREARERCGWQLKVVSELGKVLPPTAEEVAILRRLDPERLFLGK